MELICDKVLKSNPQRDSILPIKDIKSITIKGLVYFFGGTIENNNSNTIFHYDPQVNEIVKYNDVPTQKEIILLFKDTDLVSIDSDGNVYVLENNKWVHDGNVNISMPCCGVVTKNNQYIIADQKLYEFNNRSLVLIKESETIGYESYIPSPDKDIIYFKNSTLDLKSGEIYNNSNQGDYIFYNDSNVHDSKNNFTIDKTNMYFVEFDSPITCIKIRTMSSKEWWITDYIKDYNKKKFGAIKDIIPNDDKIFFCDTRNSINTAYSTSLDSGNLIVENSIKRENYSYSKNIKYNHYTPKILKFNNSVAFVGNSGFYRDTGEYDNSIFSNNEVIISLSLNIESPIYRSSNNTVLIMDQPNTQLHQYSYRGDLLNTIEIPIIEDIIDYRLSNNLLILDTNDITYIYDISKKIIVNSVAHHTSIASTISKNFLFTLINRDGYLQISRTSLFSNRAVKTNTGLETSYKKMNIYSNSNDQIIMYVEKENTDWIMYRIIFDE